MNTTQLTLQGGARHGAVRQGGARLGWARQGVAWLGMAMQCKGTGLQPPVHYIILQGLVRHGLARFGTAWPGMAGQGNARKQGAIPALYYTSGSGAAWLGWAGLGWAWHGKAWNNGGLQSSTFMLNDGE